MTKKDAGYAPAPPADFILPFDLPGIGLRGRIARLDEASSRALIAHPLPEAAQCLLAEALILSTLLGSALKLEGRLSVQLKGDGPLSLLVADYFAGGGLRGYARFDESRLNDFPADAAFSELAGEGALAITIEPKLGAQAYQGLVPLSPEGLARSAEGYFDQSEQLPTLIKLSAGPIYRAGEENGWRAGGIMVQAVPEKIAGEITEADDWQRVQMFLETLEPFELLDTDVSAESVLWRLFHEDEVRVQPSRVLKFQCTCHEGKVRSVLSSYPEDALAELAEKDRIVRTRCEFCGEAYVFPLEELAMNPKTQKQTQKQAEEQTPIQS
ncbi:MAG: Hsp33 family molecular chaperone HslO [Micropepsaceae bacterium]